MKYFNGILWRNFLFLCGESESNGAFKLLYLWDLINGKKVTPTFFLSPRALNKKREYSTLIFYKGSFPFGSNLTWKRSSSKKAVKRAQIDFLFCTGG